MDTEVKKARKGWVLRLGNAVFGIYRTEDDAKAAEAELVAQMQAEE